MLLIQMSMDVGLYTSTLQLYYSLVWRASVTELFGSATLVFAIDTIVISTHESETKMPNLIMVVLIGIVIIILLLATFPISDGRKNPVITLSAMLIGLITISRTFFYMLVQFAGGILGAFAFKVVVGSSIYLVGLFLMLHHLLMVSFIMMGMKDGLQLLNGARLYLCKVTWHSSLEEAIVYSSISRDERKDLHGDDIQPIKVLYNK